jgi:flavoprotein
VKITENVVTKIAVCISGQARYWETTYKLFEHWNKIYDDVEFVFFLSTWKDTGFDFSEYKFLQDVEVLSLDVIPKHITSQY